MAFFFYMAVFLRALPSGFCSTACFVKKVFLNHKFPDFLKRKLKLLSTSAKELNGTKGIVVCAFSRREGEHG